MRHLQLLFVRATLNFEPPGVALEPNHYGLLTVHIVMRITTRTVMAKMTATILHIRAMQTTPKLMTICSSMTPPAFEEVPTEENVSNKVLQ